MGTLIKVGIGMLVLAFVLIGVSYSMLRAQGISSPSSAAGRAVRGEVRNVNAGITAVALEGPINLTLSQGAQPSLRVRGEQRLLANVDTSVDGDTLRIGTKGMLFHHRNPLTVELVLPSLRQLQVRGSGDSTVNGFSGPAFVMQLHGSGNLRFNGRFKRIDASVDGSGDLNLNGGNSDSVVVAMLGSGKLTASGASQTLEAELTGSGDLDAEHLATERVTLLLQGSGTANVFARDRADLTLRGSGDIRVFGKPQVRNARRNGSGEISYQ